LLDLPQVRGVVRAEELVGSAFLPPVVTNFKATKEILSCQHWMLLVPDDPLAEVQAVGLQVRWVVAQVGIAAPDVERPPRLQDPPHVPKPGVEQPVELLVGDVVVGQGAVPSP